MAIKDMIWRGIGQSTSPAIAFFLTKGLALGAVADDWTPVTPATTSWTSAAQTTTAWTKVDPTTTAWAPDDY